MKAKQSTLDSHVSNSIENILALSLVSVLAFDCPAVFGQSTTGSALNDANTDYAAQSTSATNGNSHLQFKSEPEEPAAARNLPEESQAASQIIAQTTSLPIGSASPSSETSKASSDRQVSSEPATTSRIKRSSGQTFKSTNNSSAAPLQTDRHLPQSPRRRRLLASKVRLLNLVVAQRPRPPFPSWYFRQRHNSPTVQTFCPGTTDPQSQFPRYAR